MTTRFVSGNRIPIPDSQDVELPAHLPWCFGCGPDNQHGLALKPRREGDAVVAELKFAPWFQGGPGVVHGGAVAAFFDDLMGFVLLAHRSPGVTAKLEVNYRRPIALGMELRGEAWLSAREGRKSWVEATGVDAAGSLYVEGRALFLAVGPEHYRDTVGYLSPADRAKLDRLRSENYYP